MRFEVFEPNRSLKLGIAVWPCMARELFEARELIWILFKRNLVSRYRQALLGFFWAVITPFVAIGTFVFLKKAGVVQWGVVGVPYVLFALVGLMVYQIFSSGLSAGCGALVEAGDMIAKVNFSRTVLVLAALAGTLFDSLVRMVLIAMVCFWTGFLPSWSALLFFPALIPILFLTIGLALLLALLNAVFRDTAPAVTMMTMFLMFLTPVLYQSVGRMSFWVRLNPLTALVNAPRDFLLYGGLQDPFDFFLASAAAFLVFLAGWRLFYLAEARIPERI